MKNLFLNFIVPLAFIATCLNVKAQELIALANTKNLENLPTVVLAESERTNIKNEYKDFYRINFNAARDFMTTYPNITQVKWEVLNEGFIASFVLNSVWEKNYYNKKGRWLYSIDQYDETKLPKTVRASVKSIYYDYSITVVKEVNTKRNKQEPLYFVHLEYKDLFKTIKVYNGEQGEVIVEQ